MGGRRQPKDKRLSEVALIAATGISHRKLIRRRQQGLVPTIEPRHGLGRGRGTTAFEYPLTAVATIKRLCRQLEKPYQPLRTASLAAFMSALVVIFQGHETAIAAE